MERNKKTCHNISPQWGNIKSNGLIYLSKGGNANYAKNSIYPLGGNLKYFFSKNPPTYKFFSAL